MSSYSVGFGRVSDSMLSMFATGALSRTNLKLFQAQQQLMTGRAINRPSDDAVRSATILSLDERIERNEQVKRNLSHADSSLLEIDEALGDANELLLQAKQIASAQVSTGTSADERQGQAVVINSLIDGLLGVANRSGIAGHIFGGTTPGQAPVSEFRGGYRYTAQGQGLITDLGLGVNIPLTLGPGNAVGDVSARIRGSTDLSPGLSTDTRLKDLAGARGTGVTPGVIEFSFDGGPVERIDLREADSMGNVVDAVRAAILRYEEAHEVEILGPEGVGFEGDAIRIDVLADGPDAPELRFGDIGDARVAQDLGLADSQGDLAFSAQSTSGAGLSPKLRWTTPLEAIDALDLPLGSVRVRNAGATAVVDLSQAETLQDIRNAFEGAGLGVRVRLNEAGNGIDLVNEVAGGRGRGLVVEEIPGNDGTASALGIRSLDTNTRLSDFNDGRGVEVLSGATDPETGDPRPEKDVDFAIQLGNGFEIMINLGPDDVHTVESLLNAINTQANTQLDEAGLPAELFEAGLTDGPNGIALRQDTDAPGMDGPITIQQRNNSPAAIQLGFTDGTYDPEEGIFLSKDNAEVRVDSIFAHLIDLRDALESNDTFGITLAGEKLEEAVDRLSRSRAVVGGHSVRVDDAMRTAEDREVMDRQIRSELMDADFTEVATRMSQLETQLAAGYQVASRIGGMSLLDFLR